MRNLALVNDHWKKNLFINNSNDVLIRLKEGHQGLLKLHVYLGGVPVWGEMGLQFCFKQKCNTRRLSGPAEILCIFWKRLGGFSSRKDEEATKKEVL